MRGILKRNMLGNMLNNYTKRIAAGEEEEEDGWLLPCIMNGQISTCCNWLSP
jgi:hypothetical protein